MKDTRYIVSFTWVFSDKIAYLETRDFFKELIFLFTELTLNLNLRGQNILTGVERISEVCPGDSGSKSAQFHDDVSA